MIIFNYVVTIVLAISVSLLLYLWTKSRRDKSWPPGPPSLPVIGNISVLAGDMMSNFRNLRLQYGDIFSLIIGPYTVVVVNSVEALKELNKEHADVTSGRADIFMSNDMVKYQGIVASSGDVWKMHRKFFVTTMKEFGFGTSKMEALIRTEIEIFIAKIREYNSKPIDFDHLLNICIINVICSVLTGSRYEHDDESLKELIGILSQVSTDGNIMGLLNFLPFLKHIPGDPFGHSNILKNVDRMNKFFSLIVEEHKRNMSDSEGRNYVDAYLKHQINETERATIFTDNHLIANIRDIYGASCETTSNTVRWLVLSLLFKSHIQQRMRKEIQEVVGDSRFPSLADKANLPYSDAVIHETFRWRSVLPLGIPNGVSEEFSFRGYIIPKNSVLFKNLDSVLNDPTVFKDPNEFKPSRFMTVDGRLQPGFYLEIYEGESNSPKKTYTALSDNDPHYKKHPVCAEGEKDLSVKIDADDYFTDGLNNARRKEPSKAYFRLRITGVKTLDFSATYGPLIGGVVAVIVIFAIIIAIGLFVYHRRKKYSGSVQRPSKE